MFCPSSLTNRRMGLNLEFLDSLEFHIQNIAEVDHSTFLSSPGFILHVKGPNEQIWTSQPPSTSPTSLSTSLCPKHTYTGNICSLPFKEFLERTNLGNRPRWALQVCVRLV